LKLIQSDCLAQYLLSACSTSLHKQDEGRLLLFNPCAPTQRALNRPCQVQLVRASFQKLRRDGKVVIVHCTVKRSPTLWSIIEDVVVATIKPCSQLEFVAVDHA
jgi:hypothetical protein